MTESIAAPPAVLKIAGLTKSYDQRTVLRGVDLEVPEGQLLGLIGPNGAGKTTLLRCLVGLVQRSGGDAQVFSHDPTDSSLPIRRRTCYLPGETGVYHQMTGARFLKFALGFYPDHSLDLNAAVAAVEAPPAQPSGEPGGEAGPSGLLPPRVR